MHNNQSRPVSFPKLAGFFSAFLLKIASFLWEEEKTVDNAQSADSINEADEADDAAEQDSIKANDTENTESEDAPNGENN